MTGIAFEKKILDELTHIKAELHEIQEHIGGCRYDPK